MTEKSNESTKDLTTIYPTTLPPWMIDILNKAEIEEMGRQSRVPIHLPLPLPINKEIRDEENDVKESTIIEFDI